MQLGVGRWCAVQFFMSKYSDEEVLVVRRSFLEEIGMFQGIMCDNVDGAFEKLLSPGNHFFVDRAAAEEDPSLKQLIPYCIFRCGDSLLHYTRGKSGGERRLHAKVSVGIGGHVNPVDSGEGRTGAAAYFAAVAREISEELELPGTYEQKFLGLINDDSTAVGEVHLGLIHLIDLTSTDVLSREDALLELKFSPLTELSGKRFSDLETWSQLCVEHLTEQCTNPK